MALAAGMIVLAAYIGIAASMRFHLCLNDLWAWIHVAGHSSFADPASMQNGFMPPAYIVYLKLLGPAADIAGAFVLNLVAVGVTLAALVALARRVEIPGAAWLAVMLLALWPPFLQSGLTAGPDIVAAALLAVAAALYWNPDRSGRHALLAGTLVGLALLVRGHALVAGIALVVAPAMVDRRVDRAALWMLAGIGGGVATQIALNLFAGAPPWDNGQAFNVSKMVYGVDWYAPETARAGSVLELFRDDPGRFLYEWAGAFRRLGQWIVGPLLAWWWAARTGRPSLARLAALGSVAGALYCVPVSLGDSPRAAVTIGTILLAPVAALFAAVRADRPQWATVLLACVLAFGVVHSLRADRAFLAHNRAQARDFACVEDQLLEHGIRSARAVFTDDFDLYFRSLEGRRPLTRGGWGVVGIDGWTDVYPQLPTTDADEFLAACRDAGVRVLALTKKSRGLGSEIAKLRYDALAAGAEPIGVCGEFVLIAVPPQP